MVKVQTALEDLVNLGHFDVLNYHVTVGNSVLLPHGLVSCRLSCLFFGVLLVVRIKVRTVTKLALAEVNHFLKLRNAIKDKEPARTQIVPIDSGQLQDLPDNPNVFVFYLFIAAYLCKLGHRSNEGISFSSHVEIAADFDRVSETFNTESCCVLIICLLQKN